MKRLGAGKYNDNRMVDSLDGELSSTLYDWCKGSNIFPHVHDALRERLLHRVLLYCDVTEELR